MHSAATPRFDVISAVRRATIVLDFVLAGGLAFLAADSLVTIVDYFGPLEALPRGAAFLWRLRSYVPASVQFAATAALFAAAAVGLRRQTWWRWWAQGTALAILLFPFAVRLLLG